MKYKFVSTIFMIVISAYLLQADNPLKDPYVYLNENGLDMYLEPNINSEVVKELKFGDILFLAYSDAFWNKTFNDTVNNISGEWKYMRKDESSGFVFSPYTYLTYGKKLIREITDNDFRLTREGLCYGEMDYHPDLHWYGFYYESNQFYLKKINVTMHLITVEGRDFFKGYECVEDNSIMLKTDCEQRSLFLIGTLNDFTEGDIPHEYFNAKTDYSQEEGYLYPEQKIEIFYKRSFNYLRAYESVIVDSVYNYVKNYQLEYVIKDYNKQNKPESVINLSNSLGLYGTARQHSKYLTPKLYWAGDLNNDNVLDIIVYQHGMVNHGGTYWSHTLFLSQIENDVIYIKKVDSAIRVSCF